MLNNNVHPQLKCLTRLFNDLHEKIVDGIHKCNISYVAINYYKNLINYLFLAFYRIAYCFQLPK